MTSALRPLARFLAILTIAASTAIGALQGATGAAYASHVDRGCAMYHCRRPGVHTSHAHPRLRFPAHARCVPCEWRHPK